MELYDELEKKNRQLDACIRMLRKSGTEWAEAERTYNVTKHDACLRLKDKGMAVGLIEMIHKGIKEVANARFKMQVAEVTYKANQEAVMAVKLQLRLIEKQIDREYSRPQADM